MTMPNPQQMIINGGFKLGKSSMLSIRYLSLRERRFAVFFWWHASWVSGPCFPLDYLWLEAVPPVGQRFGNHL